MSHGEVYVADSANSVYAAGAGRWYFTKGTCDIRDVVARRTCLDTICGRNANGVFPAFARQMEVAGD